MKSKKVFFFVVAQVCISMGLWGFSGDTEPLGGWLGDGDLICMKHSSAMINKNPGLGRVFVIGDYYTTQVYGDYAKYC